jgi:hypothetical protein
MKLLKGGIEMNILVKAIIIQSVLSLLFFVFFVLYCHYKSNRKFLLTTVLSLLAKNLIENFQKFMSN